jgi:hypothetical protein
MATIGAFRWIAAIIAASTLAWGGSAAAADDVHWATGAVMQRRLADEVNIQWANNPLRQAIEHLSRVKRVAILIDRRVDPGQRLEITLSGVPLEAALRTIASRAGLGVSRLGNVVYLGPAPVAKRLPAVAAAMQEDVRGLPPSMQRKYRQSKRLAWEDLATPRDLLTELGRGAGLTIDGLQQMPHDLWAAADLPPISLVDRLTLVAIQFDLAFKITDGGKRLELVHLPPE